MTAPPQIIERALTFHFAPSVNSATGLPDVMEVAVLPLGDASSAPAGATFTGGLRTATVELVYPGPNTAVFDLIPSYTPGLTAPILYRVMWRAGALGRTYTYDFAMPEESEVCAAREGEVVAGVQHHDGHGYRWPNNKVVVRHDDGTLGAYLHIRKDGSLVAEGDRVARGQAIALSGHVGNSMLPHLHFHVSDPARGETVPVSFADVARHRGVPRMFCRYMSGNAPTP